MTRPILAPAITAFLLALPAMSLRAQPRAFPLSGATLTLEDASDAVEIRFQSFRLNRAQNTWNVEVTLSNRSARTVSGPLLLSVDGFTGTSGPLQVDGADGGLPPKPFWDLSLSATNGFLAPGAMSRPRTLTLGRGTGTPQLSVRLFAAPARTNLSLALTRSLNAFGQPLPGVTIEESGPAGLTTNVSDATSATVTLGQDAGAHAWKFLQPGHLPAWRRLDLSPGTVTRLPAPRLVGRSPQSFPLSTLDGGSATNSEGTLRIDFAPGVGAAGGSAILTSLDGQTLPLLLPPGWSPMQAFWLEMAGDAAPSAQSTMVPAGPVSPSETLALAQLDEAALEWKVRQLVPGRGTNPLSVPLNGAGAYVLALADAGSLAPPSPQVGEALASAPGALPVPESLTASGSVSPPSSSASRQPEPVTARAVVTITNAAGALPSGLVFPCEFQEEYRLQDGTRRRPPLYDNFIVAYQRPGDADPTTLHAQFPLRPLLLFGPEELEQATLSVDVLSPAPFSGGVLDEAGGFLAVDGIALFSGGGDVVGRQAAQVRGLDPSDFGDLIPTNVGVSVVAGFELTVSGVAADRRLVPRFTGLAPNALFVLARVAADASAAGLTPVERFATDPAGTLASLEPGTVERLPGITQSGQYLLLRAASRQALVRGVARNSAGQPGAGLPVRVAGQPWLVFSGPGGEFRTLAPAGSAELVITDRLTGDTGRSILTVTDPDAPLAATLSTAAAGPRVVSVTPADGAIDVSRVTAIEVVFSEPVNPASLLPAGIQVLGTNGHPVAASLTLNLANTRAALLPTDPLAAGQRFLVQLGVTVADLSGLPLEGAREFEFTTERLVARTELARLTVYEPGATNVPPEVLARLVGYTPGSDSEIVVAVGSPGTAEAEAPVLLVNETTGETSTLLSGPEGSFVGFIRADEADFVSAVLVNANGSRSRVPASRQLFDDGSVGLYEGGGILEAQSDQGPVELRIEPGAIPNRSKLKLEPLPLAELLQLVKGQQPQGGRLLGGLRYRETGDALTLPADVSFPVRLGDLGLPPGLDPTNATYALTIPREFEGVVVYDLIDTMSLEATAPGEGRLVTRSPPFPGLLARRLALVQQAALQQDTLGSVSVSAAAGAQAGVSVGAGVLVLDLPLSAGAKIAGHTRSGRVNEDGQFVEPFRPTAGALVVVDRVGGAARPPSFFSPGEMVATSDEAGAFATYVPPSLQGGGREVVAVHPRFPLQKARVPLFTENTGTSVARVDLIFNEGPAAAGEVSGTAPPVVALTFAPALPPVSPDGSAFATLVLSAADDREVQALGLDSVQVAELYDAGGNPIPPGLEAPVVSVTLDGAAEGTLSRRVQRYRISATARVRARVVAQVIDDQGLTARVETMLNFGFSASVTPEDPADQQGPHVASVWPPPFAENIPALAPLIIRFSEPVLAEDLDPENWAGWLLFDSQHQLRFLEPSPDRRQVTVFYEGDPSGDVAVTVQAPLRDRNGNFLDQDPSDQDPTPFNWTFQQAGQRVSEFEGDLPGGGMVIRGRFAYGLERGPDSGALVCYDLAEPDEPEVVGSLRLGGRPTTLALIPDYPMRSYAAAGAEGGPFADDCTERTLLAVFSGAVNEPKRLLLVPARGTFEDLDPPPVSARLSLNDAATIVKSHWDPPFLGYLELAEVNSLTLLNLPAFHLGATLQASDPSALSNLPDGGNPGLDADGDGDYCDPGDQPPLPFLDPLLPFGFAFSWAPETPDERLEDFDFLSDLGLVAVISRSRSGTNAARFRVVLAAASTNSLENAAVAFASGLRPRRLTLLPATRAETPTGPRLFDLALVSCSGADAAEGALVVIDVTDPAAPQPLATVPLPTGSGTPGSLRRRPDGLLALATSTRTYLLNPTRLLLPAPAGFGSAAHPAIEVAIDLPAGGVRDFASEPSGLHASLNGDQRQLVQTDPRFQVVAFTNEPFAPETLLAQPEPERRNRLAAGRAVEVVEVARTDADGQVVEDLAPERHHYIVVDAPGSAAGDDGWLPVAVAAIHERGELYDRSARMAVPSVLGDPSVHKALLIRQLFRLILALEAALEGDTTVGPEVSPLQLLLDFAGSEGAQSALSAVRDFLKLWESYPADFRARRMSDDPTSALYNRFVAGPFLVLPNSPDQSTLDLLLQQASGAGLPRRYVRASPRLWVGFPQDLDANDVLEQYASQFRLNPSVTVQGVELPVLSSLAESLLSTLVGGSDTVGPLLVSALQAAIQTVAPDFLQFLTTDYRPTLLPGANLLRPVAYKDRPLVFVGGFGGSRISDNEGEIWPDLVRLRIDTTALSVAPNGNTFVETIPTDTLRHVLELGPIRAAGIYHGLLEFLKQDLGYVEYEYRKPEVAGDPSKAIQLQRRRFGGQPILDQEPAPTLFVFAYDWRLDNARAAQLLKEYVDIVRYYHPDADGIDLMAHSNGNLVSRRFMLDQPGVVKRYFGLAAPLMGSGKPFAGILTGDMEDVMLNFAAPIDTLRQSTQFMPGFHQLMVNQGLMNLGFRPLQEAGFDLNRNGRAYEQYDYGQYAEALEHFLFRDTHREVGFRPPSPARANHEDFHRPQAGLPIADWRAVTDLEAHQFIGMQSVPRSLAGVRLAGRLHRSRTNVLNLSLELPAMEFRESERDPEPDIAVGEPDGSLGIGTNQFRFRGDYEWIKTLGDGTVPILSLARGFGAGAALDYNAIGSRVYALVSPGAARDDEVGHNPMLNNPVLHGWLRQVLEGRRVKQLTVQPNLPLQVAEGSRFTLSLTAAGGGAGGGNFTFLADFADGATAALVAAGGAPAQVTHRYRQNGVRVVSLGATDGQSLSGFTSRAIEVTNVAPTVSIDPTSPTATLGEVRIITARVDDPGLDDSHRFSWRLDGDVLPGREQFAVAVAFTRTGSHVLEVVATDSDGAQGTNSTTLDVVAGPPPAAGPAPTGFRGFELTPMEGPAVFERQPRVFLRVTGHAPGPGDTKGFAIRESDQPSFGLEDFPLPPLSGGLAAYQEVRRILRRSKTGLVDQVVQRGFRDSTTIDLFRSLDDGGSSPVISDIEFETAGGPIELELLYSEGGVPIQFVRWETNALANTPARLRFEWTSQEGTPLFEPTVSVATRPLAPLYSALGEIRAGDQLAPAVAALYNPASGEVVIRARDNVSPDDRLELFLAQDASGDGRLEDEVFYPLTTNVLNHARLPSRAFAIVARDEIGNVSGLEGFTLQRLSNYAFEHDGTGGYCESLDQIRNSILSVIEEGLNAPAVAGAFLLDPAHLWIFEQGSGACLWKPDACAECNGNFVPGVSDNDYELFLPVHLERNYLEDSETDRLEFLAADPYAEPTLRGDWYFRPPEGITSQGQVTTDPAQVVAWRYALPSGFQTSAGASQFDIPKAVPGANLLDGFDQPLVPAEIISRTLTGVIAHAPAPDPGETDIGSLLKETTFFPARREHFMYGVFDLELPPADGSDPIGDGGCGRRMLLLKWVLEGEFVSTDPALGVNESIPSLDTIWARLRNNGIPLAEGWEWGLFQEFAALDGGVAKDLKVTYGPDAARLPLQSAAGHHVEDQRKKKLKKMGKSAIRAALARLAGDSETAERLFDVDRQLYQERRLRSFEDYILNVITNQPGFAEQLFGGFGLDRPTAEGPDLFDFLRAKKADDDAFFREILADPEGYRRFILGGLEFLRTRVQAPTQPFFDAYLEGRAAGGGAFEVAQRERNLSRVLNGSGSRKGLNQHRATPELDSIALVVGAHNYTAKEVPQATATIESPPAPAGPVPFDDEPTVEVPLSLPALSGDAEGDDATEATLRITTPSAYGAAPVRRAIRLEAPTQVEGDPLAVEGSAIDDELFVDAEVLPANAPPVRRTPRLLVSVLTEEGTELPLVDHPATGGRPRSPALFLMSEDRIRLRVITGTSGQTISVGVSTNDSTDVLFVDLAESPPGSGQYENVAANQQLRVGPATSSGPNGHVQAVRDEELMSFVVASGDLELPAPLQHEVVVDRAELASAGIPIKRSSGQLSVEPRPTVRNLFTGVPVGSTPPELHFFTAGDREFPPEVGQSGPGLANGMGQFLLRAGLDLPGSGEGDLLYSLSHGLDTGNLVDELSLPPADVILRPITDFSDPARWSADLDFVHLHACSTLDEPTPLPVGGGAAFWRETMRSRARPPHMIFGYHQRVHAGIEREMRLFARELRRGTPFIVAYTTAMELSSAQEQKEPWAILFFESTISDSLRTLNPDPRPDEPVGYLRFEGTLEVFDCMDDELGAGPGLRAGGAPAIFADVCWIGRELPPALQLDRAPLPAALPGGLQLDADSGHPLYRHPRELQLRVASSLDAVAAGEVARDYLTGACQLSSAKVRLLGAAALTYQRVEANEPGPASITGYSVRFESLEHGVPVRDAETVVSLAGDEVARVVLRPVRATASPGTAGPIAEPVLDPEPLVAAWIAAGSGPETPSWISKTHPPRLYWVPERPLSGAGSMTSPGSGNRHVPAWRLRVERGLSPGSGSSPAPREVWFHATRGHEIGGVR